MQEVKAVTINGKSFDIATVDLRTDEIRMFWKSGDGTAFSSLRRLKSFVDRKQKRFLLATNGGIFDKNYAPEGLYAERGRTLIPLNRRTGGGNFYLKPNGVFFVDKHGAGILSAEDFLRNRIEAIETTQSGPMLVRNGQINSIFDPHSKNQCIRNGIGVLSPQKVFIAISRENVSFYEFASLFRNVLGCKQALYLDGNISKLYRPQASRLDDGQFVTMLAVLKS